MFSDYQAVEALFETFKRLETMVEHIRLFWAIYYTPTAYKKHHHGCIYKIIEHNVYQMSFIQYFLSSCDGTPPKLSVSLHNCANEGGLRIMAL